MFGLTEMQVINSIAATGVDHRVAIIPSMMRDQHRMYGNIALNNLKDKGMDPDEICQDIDCGISVPEFDSEFIRVLEDIVGQPEQLTEYPYQELINDIRAANLAGFQLTESESGEPKNFTGNSSGSNDP